jgi:hypothetical protein
MIWAWLRCRRGLTGWRRSMPGSDRGSRVRSRVSGCWPNVRGLLAPVERKNSSGATSGAGRRHAPSATRTRIVVRCGDARRRPGRRGTGGHEQAGGGGLDQVVSHGNSSCLCTSGADNLASYGTVCIAPLGYFVRQSISDDVNSSWGPLEADFSTSALELTWRGDRFPVGCHFLSGRRPWLKGLYDYRYFYS